MSLGDLMVRVGANVDGFSAAMAEAQDGAAEAMLSIRESMEGAGEAMVELGEKASLTAGEMSSAFGGLSAILGGGVIVGALGEMLEKTAENVTEFGHSSEAIGLPYREGRRTESDDGRFRSWRS